ncbi:MAG: PD-(D/E)XK nuclease family protein [Kiritimatiellia bacterium]
MSSGHRKFLGWDVPVTGTVAAFLLEGRAGRPLDLSDTLVITPTKQAGRALRRELAEQAAERGTAVIGAQVVPTSFLFAPDASGRPVAGDLVQTAAWVETLRKAPPGLLEPVFPGAGRRESLWARQAAASLQQLRSELCDGGESIGSIVAKHAERLEEHERWQAMAALETLYLQRLAKADLADAFDAKIRAAANPRIDPGIRRLVVAAVPDPSLLALSALRALAQRLETFVLVQAPEALAEAFDEWGRPVPAAWKERRIDLPGGNDALLVAQDPQGECREVIRAIREAAQEHRPPSAPASEFGGRTSASAGFTAADLAVSVADPPLSPFLQRALKAQGLEFSDPSDAPLSAHPIARLAAGFFACRRERRFADVAEWLRHPDLLEALHQEQGTVTPRILEDLDDFRLKHLPVTLDDALEHFDGPVYRHRDGKYGDLGKALRHAETALDPATPVSEAVVPLLQRVYRHVRVGQRTTEDRDFRSAAEAVMEAFGEVGSLARAGFKLDDGETIDLLRDQLASATYSADRPAREHDLYGWLELAWLPAPLLIVTGMREGAVPDTRVRDPFLPDTLRRLLGLRNDETRLARDAHLLTQLAEQRRAAGRLILTFARTGPRGDAQKPSRLLFRTPPADLPARARRLFLDPAPPPPPTPAATMSFTLDHTRPPERSREPGLVLSASALRAYLACPFRYYLGHVAGLRTVKLDKDEPDAMDFGNLIHHALKMLGGDPAMARSADEAKVAALLEEAAREEARRVYGSNPGLPVRMAVDTAALRLKAAANMHAGSVRAGWRVLAVDKEFKLNRGVLNLIGRIDRIERHEESGIVRVIDYKTSNEPADPVKAHCVKTGDEPDWRALPGGTMRWADLQLPLYAVHAGMTPEYAAAGVVAAYANLPVALTESRVSEWLEESGPGPSREVCDSALACAVEAARRIQAGVFGPPAPAPDHDDLAEAFGLPLEELFGLAGYPWPDPEARS